MKNCYRFICCILFLSLSASSVLANTTLIWNGYGVEDEQVVIKYNMEDGVRTELQIPGYLIETDLPSTFVVVNPNAQDKSFSMKAYALGNTDLLWEKTFFLDAARILAYKSDWLYYVTIQKKGSEERYLYCRMDEKGAVQQYPALDYQVQYEDPFDDTYLKRDHVQLTLSISNDGLLAYSEYPYPEDIDLPTEPINEPKEGQLLIPAGQITPEDIGSLTLGDYDDLSWDIVELKIVSPAGDVRSIGNGKYPAWMDENRLLYEKAGSLWVFHYDKNESTQYLTKSGETIPLSIHTGSLSVDLSGRYITYVEYKPQYLLFWEYLPSMYQPFALVSLIDGTKAHTEEVLLRERDWAIVDFNDAL